VGRAARNWIAPAGLRWIAATALVNRFPLVTRNRREFSRVPALDVIDY
jgi:predicted nucleic acid-binding protein